VFWFQFKMFDNSESQTDDSFAELTSGVAMTSLPDMSSSPKSALGECTPRWRVSRALTFDGDASPGTWRSSTGTRPSLTARRRCPRAHAHASVDQSLLHTSTTVNDDVNGAQPCPSHVTVSSVISGCIEKDEERADLIGDMTAKHVLPLESSSKHVDLKTISAHTVSHH